MFGDLGLWGVLISIAGILMAIYFYFKTRIKKTASIWYKISILLADSKSILPEEVTIQFDGKPISHLKKMNVVFWNAGNITIDGNDIVLEDPLRVALEGEIEVFKVSLAAETKPANGTKPGKPTAQNKEFPVEFTYLDPGQGLNLEVLYQGKLARPVFHGTIKGIPHGFTDVVKSAKNFYNMVISQLLPYSNSSAVISIVLATFGLFVVRSMEFPTTELDSADVLPPSFAHLATVAYFIRYGFYAILFYSSGTILVKTFWRRKFLPPDDLLV